MYIYKRYNMYTRGIYTRYNMYRRDMQHIHVYIQEIQHVYKRYIQHAQRLLDKFFKSGGVMASDHPRKKWEAQI